MKILLTHPGALWWLLLWLPLWWLLAGAGRRVERETGSLMLWRKLGQAAPGGTRRRVWIEWLGYSALFGGLVLLAAGLSRADAAADGPVWRLFVDDSIQMRCRVNDEPAWKIAARRCREWLDDTPHASLAIRYSSGRAAECRADSGASMETLFVPGMSLPPAATDAGDGVYVGMDARFAGMSEPAIVVGGTIRNLSISAFAARAAGDGQDCYAEIRNTGSRPMTADWELRDAEDTQLASGRVELAAGDFLQWRQSARTDSMAMTLRLLTPDDFEFDNCAVVERRATGGIEVLAAEGRPWIEKALLAAGFRLAASGDEPIGRVVEDGEIVADDDALPTIHLAPKAIAGATMREPVTSPSAHYAPDAAEAWRRLRFQEIRVDRFRRCTLPPAVWKAVLVDPAGNPLIAESGKTVAVMFSPADSDWPGQPSFPLFFREHFLRHAVTTAWQPRTWPVDGSGMAIDEQGRARWHGASVGLLGADLGGWSETDAIRLPADLAAAEAAADRARPLLLLAWLAAAGYAGLLWAGRGS